jgi:hypothetical protein
VAKAVAEAAAVQQGLDLCGNVTERVLKAVVEALQARSDVDLSAAILKVV